MQRIVIVFVATILLALGAVARADTYFAANLTGAQEVPPFASTGIGFGRATLDATETQLTISVYYSGLVGTVTAAHVHGPAAPGANAPVMLALSVTTGVNAGSVVAANFAVTPTQVANLRAGLTYLNVHTTSAPGGEIRGQLLPDSPVFADLSGRQEVPATNVPGRGWGVVSMNPSTQQALVSLSFSGLSASATAGHMHQAPAGANGPVVCALPVPTATSGTVIDALCTLDAGQFAALSSAGMYLNLHSSNFPGGELRGQIDVLLRDGFD